jgi:hypothetical protein
MISVNFGGFTEKRGAMRVKISGFHDSFSSRRKRESRKPAFLSLTGDRSRR